MPVRLRGRVVYADLAEGWQLGTPLVTQTWPTAPPSLVSTPEDVSEEEEGEERGSLLGAECKPCFFRPAHPRALPCSPSASCSSEDEEPAWRGKRRASPPVTRPAAKRAGLVCSGTASQGTPRWETWLDAQRVQERPPQPAGPRGHQAFSGPLPTASLSRVVAFACPRTRGALAVVSRETLGFATLQPLDLGAPNAPTERLRSPSSVSRLAKRWTLSGLHLGPNFAGDLGSAMPPLANLRSLVVHQGVHVRGFLSIFAPLCRLQVMDIRQAKMAGDIRHLGGLHDLTTLVLPGDNCSEECSVYGDLGHLSGLQHLRVLVLAHTKVSGDIAALGGSLGLELVSLSQCNRVCGNLQSLSSCSQLACLYLDSTAVAGDVAALEDCAELTELNLKDTRTSGSVDFLSAPWRLKHALLNEPAESLDFRRVPRAFNLQQTWTFHHSSHYPQSVFFA